ncbi:MAG: LysR family transcriptional regulator [Clostridiaceae bacterium]|jgi:DNA-binding transcriptional LysR family regulator|nr:LysR family transcriptional regulator [Clostridiaceae bacterium]
MNLELYRIFYSIANHGSISKAAEHLYITQPAVSRSIRQLEEEMGCTLFVRTRKGVRLTQEGEILYQYIEQAFNFITTAEKKIDDVKNLASGEVRIGVSDTLCKHYLVPYLKLFNTLHPDIKIKVTCPTTPGIINLLKSGKIDFGIINMPYHDDQLNFKNVMSVQDCFVAGEKYKHLHYKMQPLSEIVKYPVLLLEKSSNSRLYIDQYFLNHSISVTPDFELGNIDLLVHFARYDFGIACVIKNFVEEDLEKGRLYEIKPIERIPPRSIGVAWLKDVPLSKASNEIINLLDYSEISDI